MQLAVAACVLSWELIVQVLGYPSIQWHLSTQKSDQDNGLLYTCPCTRILGAWLTLLQLLSHYLLLSLDMRLDCLPAWQNVSTSWAFLILVG